MTRFSRHLEPDRLLILLFHGVIPRARHAVRNYTRKHLELARFKEILEDLQAKGTPFPLSDYVPYSAAKKRLPDGAFAITFDDGFANNATVAAPVLRRMGIPATFYVTTDFVDSNHMSWIDRIEYAVESTARVRLQHPLLGGRQTAEAPSEKKALLDLIRTRVKGDPATDPRAFADEVWKQLGVDAMPIDPDLDQKMTWDQAAALHRDALFAVGGHGHTHRILSYLSPDELEDEITTSLRLVRRHVATDIDGYSYPEGLAHCYSPAVMDLLKRHGVRCCPTAEEGTNRLGDDPFRLKRFMAI